MTEAQKTIELAVANLEKQHGKNCVMQLGKNRAMKVSVIPSGILSFDVATGVGGFPRGRIIEIFGPESSGKTTLSLQVIAQAHGTGGEAAFVDVEHALDPRYATALGVDIDKLWCTQPDNGEQALEITEALVRTNAFDVIVVDSVAALVPKAELEGEYGDAQMGLQARLMSQAMRKLTGAVSRSKTCLIFINQLREKIGVMFGSPETTTGGKALKFYSSMRIDTRKGAAIKENDIVIGTLNRIKIVKNKVAPPFRECEVQMIYGHGYSQIHDLIKLAADNGIVEKSGSWYSYKGERIGQGTQNVAAFLADNSSTAQAIFNETRAKVVPAPEVEEPKA